MKIELAIHPQDVERVKGCCGPLPDIMPAAAAETLAGTMKALADPARVQMLHMLSQASDPLCVCDFTSVLGLGQATVSHHLAKLREAGLVGVERQGIWSFSKLRTDLSPAAAAALAAITAAGGVTVLDGSPMARAAG